MRWYRLLLLLYPAAFRREYGDEMTLLFADRLATARGAAARGALLAGALPEVLLNAGAVHLDLLRQDLRLAARTYLRRSPAFALVAIAIVALGTGANTAVFSVTDHALLRPLPFPHPERLLELWENRRGYRYLELSPANYRDWSERLTTVESLAAYTRTAANLVEGGEPVRLDGALVEPALFEVLGVGPRLGRTFTEEEAHPRAAGGAGTAGVVLLSDRLWRHRFGGDPEILGRVLRLDGRTVDVVGVLPESFRFPHRDVDFWAPLQLGEESYVDRNDNYLQVVARLPASGSADGVRADLERVTAQLEAEYPVANEDAGATVQPLRRVDSQQSRLLLLALSGAALCVLLITCVNLANLLLARALARGLELRVRAVMGAGRERLTRQLLTESLVLATAGGIAGLGVARALLPLLEQLVPTTLPVASRPSLDLRVLGFTAAVTLLTGIVVGLLPVLRLRREDFTALRGGSRSAAPSTRLRSALVVAAMTGSVVLLVAAGLLLRALWAVQDTDTGFRADHVLTMNVALPMPRYESTEARVRWYREVVEEVEALPGVSSASFISFLPMTMTGGIWPVITDTGSSRREEGNVASLRFVTPGFFETLEVPLLRGRDVAWADDVEHPAVAVVSESFAERHFPGRSPLGERFEFAFFERQVVGVVGEVRVRGLERPSEPQVYLPAGQVPDGGLPFYVPKDLAVRSELPSDSLAAAVRGIVAKADPSQPVSRVRTLEQIVESQTADRKIQVEILVAFAGVALLLAAVGIHGLLAFLVAQRRREIGVRMALGAARTQILGLVLRHGLLLGSLGLALGLLIAWGVGRRLESLLAGVSRADSTTFAVVVAVCAATALAGCLVPALRALRVDPASAMRAE